MTRNDRQRALQGEIRAVAAVLRRDWDPIGNGAITDLPVDEYESYAPRLVAMIERGATDASVANYLGNLEVKAIGIASGRDLVWVARQIRAAIAALSVQAT